MCISVSQWTILVKSNLSFVPVQHSVTPPPLSPLSSTEEISVSELSPDTAGEKTKTSITGQVSVESTSNSGGEVETNIPHSSDQTDSVSRRVLSEQSQTPSRSQSGSVRATVSPTLSAESLLSESEDQQVSRDSISLTDSQARPQSLSQSARPEQEASSSPSSIVISVPSISSSMSSISSSSILPSASTTSAPEEIVTTTPLPDEDLVLYDTVPMNDQLGHDFRAGQPKTVEVTASKTSNVMEMTVPSYDRANPNRVGLLDGVVEEEDDHFLSLRAPHNSGGPLNQARAAVDGLAGLEDETGVKKSNRRAEPSPGPDISDILSGLLNVVGEGLSIATNYVQETNKKKAQEKVSTGDTLDVKPKPAPGPVVLSPEEEEERKKNNSRINNRGPPLLAARPFEAIPLEILQNQRPGAKPGVSIPQRPFQTHLPPGISGPAPTITSPGVAPFKSGVPLPQQLVPDQAGQAGPTQGESEAVLPTGLVLPTRPGYSPDFSLGQDDGGETQPELTTVNTGKLNRNKIKTNQNKIPPLPPLPEIKPVSTDPFIDLLLNEIKEGKLTTFPSSTTSRTRPTSRVTARPPVELQPSFTPPVLVTPPATPRVRPRPPNRRPWPGGPRPPTRPTRPSAPSRPKDSPPFVKKYPDWKYQPRPQSSYPTPPLNTKLTQKPLVFPTRRFPTRPGGVITGVAIPADNDVFDLTVTAQQNFGGARRTKSKYPGGSGSVRLGSGSQTLYSLSVERDLHGK